MKIAKIAFIFSAVILIISGSLFYPRWQKGRTEAQISWDASGYYWYLPSIFIYHDLKRQHFKDDILAKYHPTPDHDFQQGFLDPSSGNYVMKYTVGTALMELPFFVVANIIAKPLGYPADGFSSPYQFMIYLGGLLFALLGLWYLRKLLLFYYKERIVAIVLLLLVFGTNYLNYCGIDVGMSHVWLFTLYVFILLNTRYYYQSGKIKYALRLGGLIGLAALTRPPEFISILIPLLWGMENLKITSIKRRLSFLWTRRKHLLLAGIIGACILIIQFIYWKYVTGQWFIYSYQDQSFSWLHPHSFVYAFSYQSGWLTYTPLMIIVILGIFPFFKYGKNKVAIITMILVNYYIVSAWDVYNYGGFSGRAMVQSYPILLFLLAALIDYLLTKKWLLRVVVPFFILTAYFNLWWTYQAHAGNLVGGKPTTSKYYWSTIFRYTEDSNIQLLRDNKDLYSGKIKKPILLYENDLEEDNDSILLKKRGQKSPGFMILKPKQNLQWIRAYADVKIGTKEGDVWNMTQFIIQFKKGDKVIKTNLIRVQRLLNNNEEKEISIDVKLPPSEDYDYFVLVFENFNDKPCIVKSLKVVGFNE